MVGLGIRTLIINPGSSSIKFRFYVNNEMFLDGIVDEIGGDTTIGLLKEGRGTEIDEKIKRRVNSHEEAAVIILGLLKNFKIEQIDKVVYRVVHGGNLHSPLIIDNDSMHEIKKFASLAPLHMKNAIEIIEFFRKRIVATHIACFDSAFHGTMPEVAYRYPISSEISEKYGIRKYGFHGVSYSAMLKEVEKVAKKKYRRVIAAQLGNGASVCAIKDGKSIDTSMGFTPLEGLMMGTRSGDVDPALIQYLCLKEWTSVNEITKMLERKSGLKGVGGESNVRKLLEKKGDKKARLALEMFSYRARKYIGSYMAALGGVDCIILGGGISRAWQIRKLMLDGMEDLGIDLDPKFICRETEGIFMPLKISKGKVDVWVIETDEQQEMFDMTKHF